MKNFKNLFLLLAAMSLSLAGCKSTNAPDAPDAPHEHDEEPVRAKVIMYLGHFHGSNFHENAWPKENKYIHNPQKMELELKDGKWVVSPKSPSKVFAVYANSKQDVATITEEGSGYVLLINYYGENGDLLNGHFVEGKAINQHQHFFIPKNFVSAEDGTPLQFAADESFMRYEYMDTDPWDKSVKNDKATLIGDKNPVGLKGLASFYQLHVRFDLNVKLMHAPSGKFIKGSASPFYAPAKSQLSNNAMDVDMNIPFVTFADSNTALEAETWEQYSKPELDSDYTKEVNDQDKTFVKRIMKIYGITEHEAFDETYYLIYGDRVEDINKGFYL